MLQRVSILIIWLLSISFVLAQSNGPKMNVAKINNIELTFVQVDDDDTEPDFPQLLLEIYRNDEKILEHILSSIEGDSNSVSVELGTYEVKDSTVILYSYWALQGDAPVSPYGVRKQVYIIDCKDQPRLIDSAIYLEAMRSGWGESDYKGVDFIYKNPENKEDKYLLELYKKAVERDYNAKFVTDKVLKDNLFQEVCSILRDKIDAVTIDWDGIDSSFHYKK